MKSRKLTLLGLLIAVAATFIALSGKFSFLEQSAVSKILPAVLHPSKHKLTIVTTDSYHTYFKNKKGQTDGLAFQLIDQFAHDRHYTLNIILAKNSAEVYQALEQGIADIGLLGHPLSVSQQQQLAHTQSYMNVTTDLIYRDGNGLPSTFESLAGKTIVLHDSQRFREKQQFIAEHYPDIQWQFSTLSPEQLLGQVNNGSIDYTLIDSNDYLKLRALYTYTRSAFPVYYSEPLDLVLSQQSAPALLEPLNLYFDHIKQDGRLKQLVERYYGHDSDTNPRGSRTFFARINTRLPHYQDLIEQIAKQYQLDWHLLAAIAYQESHWDPRAKSPTGVRGMMMLTQNTAKIMGVDNRLDVEQSLRGGAQYLRRIMARLPDTIKEPDRTWFALAAYNVGLGHILDAQQIAEFHGANPNRWVNIKRYLPLLEQPQWYQYTQYGYARGSEPVSYVQNIRHFKDLLEWRFPNKSDARKSISNTRIASIRPLNEVLQNQQQQALNPSIQPVRLSALMAQEQASLQ